MLFILICTFLELLVLEGGMLGNFLAGILTPAIGTAGTYVVVIILMIICMVIITGKSALKGVTERGGQAYGRAREDAARRRELHETRRLNRIKEEEKEIEKARKAGLLDAKAEKKKKRKVKQKERTDWYQGYLSIQH